MTKRFVSVFSALLFCLSPLVSQPMNIGSPLATVKLLKMEIITEQAFKQDIAKVEATRGKPLSEAERRIFLDEKINELLFLQMCERDGIRVSDSEVDAYINQVRSQLGPNVSNEQFEKYLSSQGGTLAALKTVYKNQMLMQRWVTTAKAKEIAALPPVSTEEVLSTYDLFKAKPPIVRPDTVRITFVVYPFKDKSEAERKKGADIMKGVAEKLAKNTESFDAIRLKAQENGYISSKDSIYFEKSENYLQQFGKTVYDTVFSLKDGAISAPFETESGWWIIRRIEFLPQKILELSDPIKIGQAGTVQEFIVQSIAQKRQSDFMEKTLKELFEKLRAQAEVKIIGKP